jgi:signal transduction histidine kinase
VTTPGEASTGEPQAQRPPSHEPLRRDHRSLGGGGRVSNTLGFRLALWYAAIFVLSAAVVSGLTYALLARSLIQRDHELIRVKLADYATRYESFGLAGISDAVSAEEASGSDDRVFVRLVGPNAIVLLASMPASWGAYDLQRLGDGEGWRAVPAEDAPVALEVASRRLPGGTLLQVGRTTLARERTLRQVRDVLGVVWFGVALLGLAGGAALTRSTLAPLRALVETLRNITRTGRFDARVPVQAGGDLLSELGRVSNDLIARIQTLVEGMRGSLDTVAHDLRTPIARLRSRAEAALVGDPDPAVYREALADCVEEADRVSSLLTTLMDISEAETGVMQLLPEVVDVQAIGGETVALYEDVAEQKGVGLGCDVEAGLAVRADRQRLRQVLANLVDNAVKYTPAGGRVTITASRLDDRVVIAVADTGPGIPAEHLPHIWDRLYRAGSPGGERGLGLGLSLVKAIVEAHGGRAEVESAVGAGSTFRLVLPAP